MANIFEYPAPVVHWNGQRHSYRKFHEAIFSQLMNPEANFFISNEIQYLPIGIKVESHPDTLLVLARRRDLYIVCFGIKGFCMYSTCDVTIDGVTSLGYGSSYGALETSDFDFSSINVGPETLAIHAESLLRQMRGKNPNVNNNYTSFKPDILVLCFFLAESVRFRPAHEDAFTPIQAVPRSITGWSQTLPQYWESITKCSHHYTAAVCHYLPMAIHGTSFSQSWDESILLGSLTRRELDLVNGKLLEGEVDWTLAVERLRANSKACSFAIKLKWMFMEVEDWKDDIVKALAKSGRSGLTVEKIHDKLLRYENGVNQLKWVLLQLVKRNVLAMTKEGLFTAIHQG